MLAQGITKNNGTFSLLVKEIVVDSLLFHQTADEIEICFPVLDTVGPGPIPTGKSIFDVTEPEIIEDLLSRVPLPTKNEALLVSFWAEQALPLPTQ